MLALVACGGGGGDDNQTEGPPPATGAALVAPAAQTLQLDHTATASTLQGSFAVQFQGNASPAWTAQSDQNWLVLNGASGSGAGAFAYAVDTSQLGDLPNWGSAVANVRISANGATVMTTLTLDKRLPEITMVSPNAIAAGQTGTVRVLGRGLSRLAGAQAIRVAGATGAADATGSVVSDSEATLNLPALAQGRYAISVPNAWGMEGTMASLIAAAPSSLNSITAHQPRERASAVFDASRNAVFISTVLHGFAIREQFDGAQWRMDGIELPPEDGFVAQAGLLQMAPDGRTLYIATRRNLVAVDPDTLAIQASYPLPSTWEGAYASFVRNLAITHDLRLWFAPYTTTTQNNITTRTHLLAYFDLRTKRFETAYTASGAPAFVNIGPPPLTLNAGLVIGASGDGSRLVGIHWEAGTDNLIYDAARSNFTRIPALPANRTLTAVGQDGKTVVLDHNSLYTVEASSLSPQGAIPYTPGQTTYASILSPDGTRLYALRGATAAVTEFDPALAPDRVAVFDARATGFGSAFLPLLGTVDLPAPPAGCVFSAWEPCTPGGILQVNPRGDALLWVYHSGLMAVPIPEALRSDNASGG